MRETVPTKSPAEPSATATATMAALPQKFDAPQSLESSLMMSMMFNRYLRVFLVPEGRFELPLRRF